MLRTTTEGVVSQSSKKVGAIKWTSTKPMSGGKPGVSFKSGSFLTVMNSLIADNCWTRRGAWCLKTCRIRSALTQASTLKRTWSFDPPHASFDNVSPALFSRGCVQRSDIRVVGLVERVLRHRPERRCPSDCPAVILQRGMLRRQRRVQTGRSCSDLWTLLTLKAQTGAPLQDMTNISFSTQRFTILSKWTSRIQ